MEAKIIQLFHPITTFPTRTLLCWEDFAGVPRLCFPLIQHLLTHSGQFAVLLMSACTLALSPHLTQSPSKTLKATCIASLEKRSPFEGWLIGQTSCTDTTNSDDVLFLIGSASPRHNNHRKDAFMQAFGLIVSVD